MPIQRGSCHCGAVRFEAEGELQGLEVCNCSYCTRAGFVHWYVAPEHFRVLAGEDTLVDYQFGTHTSHNLFCPTCGVTPFRRARSDPHQIDVNVRCLDGRRRRRAPHAALRRAKLGAGAAKPPALAAAGVRRRAARRLR